MFRRIVVAAAALVLLTGAGCTSEPTAEERSVEAVRLHKLGVQEFDVGKGNDAIEHLRQAKDLQPDYRLLRFDLGRLLLRRADVNEKNSLELSEQAKQLDKAGKTAEAKAKHDQALTVYRESVYDAHDALDELTWVEGTNYPDPMVYYYLSLANTHLTEFKAARECLDRYASIAQLGPGEREQIAKIRDRLLEQEVQKERFKKQEAKR